VREETSGRMKNDPFQEGTQCLLALMGQRCLVSILSVTQETIRTSFPVSDIPLEGMMVELEFHDQQGYANFETLVLAGPKQVGDGLLLERPQNIGQARHRGAWRVPTDLKASVKPHVHPRRHQVPVVNLSAGGMLVRLSAAMQLGENVDIVMEIPGEDVESPLLGEVAHVSEAAGPDESTALVGIRFVALDPVSAKSISNYVWRRMRALYPDHSFFLREAAQ